MQRNQRDLFGKILGVIFILSGAPKLLGVAAVVENFHLWHLGEAWRYVVGAWEVTCGVLMFVPALKRFGAFGFLCVMPGAVVAHATSGQTMLIAMPIVFGLVVLAYLVREKVVQLRA